MLRFQSIPQVPSGEKQIFLIFFLPSPRQLTSITHIKIMPFFDSNVHVALPAFAGSGFTDYLVSRIFKEQT